MCHPPVYPSSDPRAAPVQDHTKIITTLTEARATVELQDGEGATALHLAAQSCHTQCAQLIIASAGANISALVNLVDMEEKTALHHAVGASHEGGYAGMVSLLCDSRTDVHKREKINNSTCLHLAARNGDVVVMRILIEHGADISAKDGAGCTAAEIAQENGVAVAQISTLSAFSAK